MPYWIFENGKTIGPLRSEDVPKRATPDSLVSYNQEWLPFREHPDFSHNGMQPSGGSEIRGGEAASDAQASPLTSTVKSAGKTPSTDDFRTDEVEATFIETDSFPKRGKAFSRAILGLLAFLVVGGLLVVLVVKKGTDRETGESHETTSERGRPGESADTVWAYSEPIDTVTLETQSRTTDANEAISIARKVLDEWVQRGEIARMENGTAWVPSSAWQALTRPLQKSMLQSLGVVRCGGCFDARRWDAVVRSVESNEILASISPNGLRVLWTAAGVFPDPAGDPSSVDLTSGMTSRERLQALMAMLERTELTLRGHYYVEGTLVERYEHEVMGTRIDGILLRAAATRVYRWDYDGGPGTIPLGDMVVMAGPEMATPQPQMHYSGTLRLQLDATTSPFGAPLLGPGLSSESRHRYELERERLFGEIRAAWPTVSDADLELLLRAAQNELRPLQEKHRLVDRSLPRFYVSGRVIDQREDRVLVYGHAFSLDGNSLHPGYTPGFDPQNLLVHQPGRSTYSVVNTEEPLYYTGTEMGIRNYSIAPPDSAKQILVELAGLSSAMRPFESRIGLLQREMDRREAERGQGEPDAMVPSTQPDSDSDSVVVGSEPGPSRASTTATGSKTAPAPNSASGQGEPDAAIGGERQSHSRSTKPTGATTDAKGNTYLPAGKSARQQIPPWVPVYSNGRFQNPSYMGMGDALIGGFEVVTSDSVDAVVAFYRTSLKNAGFAIEGDSPSSGDGGTRRINAQNRAADRKVEIILRGEGGETIVTVSYSQGR